MAHCAADSVAQRLVLKVEVEVVRAGSIVCDVEEHLDGALCDGFLVLWLAEFDFEAPNVALLVVEEDLVRVELGPRVHQVLHDLLALSLVHLNSNLKNCYAENK